ncbi:hypothetical protein SAMD00019534_113150 [Acytostelium subglobosum LB1]|uniref:hypothetical protein n=1 Tax=Acytostelium subglobosum LB1 TaxID=1410327 RepID=UPI0006447B59|nr:hypothetical protein SAMD00019534_113150 [Acytostelium subglobosum LB1]GAM28139.1 hypothetical protein SAMD00019534_113150 [Acytostelium subglobosum LB1]|eukprot:XP_012748773.1 hypothetical protein SAMD00019534_113150 [Acytostelium subglobosum LB1]
MSASVLSKVIDLLKSRSIVPDVIKVLNPIRELNVTYAAPLQTGEKLTPSKVVNTPTVTYDADSSNFYTLVMFDPDVPSRQDPKWGQWLHWVVTNIPGNKVTEGEVMADYIGSGPPEKTSYHRYIFVLCKQPSKMVFKGEYKLPFTADKRNNWSFDTFASKWNLQPEAVNFYEAEFDDAVPGLYKKLEECKEKPVLIE